MPIVLQGAQAARPRSRLAPKLVAERPARSQAAPRPPARRRLTPPNATGLLDRLLSGIGGGGVAPTAAAARRRLLAELAREQPDAAVVGEAVDELMAARVPFREADLGPGEFRVVYTRGPLGWRGPLGLLDRRPRGRVASPDGNQASQDFDPRTRQVLNYGQLLGPALALAAGGRYEPLGPGGDAAPGDSSGGASRRSRSGSRSGSSACPQLVRASIEGGELQAWGRVLPLPIRGSGLVEITYADSSLRVFRAPSTGSVTVQARRRGLEQLLGPRWRQAVEGAS